jgi:large subunit ribosomal protein L22
MAYVVNKNLEAKKTSQASTVSIKGSVQKLNLVARLIAGMPVANAMHQLQFCRKGQSKSVLAVLNSAISNAENNQGLDIDKLYVSEVKVGKAFTLKRFSARGRGRSSKIIKPYSRLTIYVTEREE